MNNSLEITLSGNAVNLNAITKGVGRPGREGNFNNGGGFDRGRATITTPRIRHSPICYGWGGQRGGYKHGWGSYRHNSGTGGYGRGRILRIFPTTAGYQKHQE